MKTLRRFSPPLVLSLAAAACGAPSPPPPSAPPAPAPAAGAPASGAPAAAAAPASSSGPTAAAAPAPAGSAETSPPPKPAPSLAETPADHLGTVPAGLGLKVGAKAPDATLPDITGKAVRLKALYAEGPTFVVFYRGGWCPFCNLQLHELTTAKPEFDKRGIHLVAISVDKPDEEAKTQAKQGVAFPMLSDSSMTALKAYNVVHRPADAEAKTLAGYGIDLDQYSGQRHHSFAVPALFLVDKSGTIRWEHVDEEFKVRPSARQMLEVADRILAK